MKKYSIKHKKKATRRMKIKKPKGGAEHDGASSIPLAASSIPLAASSIPLAASSVSPDASSVSPDASSVSPDNYSIPVAASVSPDNYSIPVAASVSPDVPWYKRYPGAKWSKWWENIKMPWNGGKKHNKKRSLKRNTKKRN